jgi:hypothetical protein
MVNMKKKIVTIAFSIFSLFLLAGCKKAADPSEASKQLVDAIVYDKKSDILSDSFSIDKDTLFKKEKTSTLTELFSDVTLSKESQEKLSALDQTYIKKFNELTSYSVKEIKNKKGKAVIALTITGIKSLDDKELEESLDKSIDSMADKITAELTDEQINQLVTDATIDTLSELINTKLTTKEKQTINLELMLDSEDTSKWTIMNQDQFVQELIEAFGSL